MIIIAVTKNLTKFFQQRVLLIIVVTKTWHSKAIPIVNYVSVALLVTMFIFVLLLQDSLLPLLLLERPWSSYHAWVVVIILICIGSVVTICFPSREWIPYSLGGLMISRGFTEIGYVPKSRVKFKKNRWCPFCFLYIL